MFRCYRWCLTILKWTLLALFIADLSKSATKKWWRKKNFCSKEKPFQKQHKNNVTWFEDLNVHNKCDSYSHISVPVCGNTIVYMNTSIVRLNKQMMKIVWIFDSVSKKQKYPIQFNFESIEIVNKTTSSMKIGQEKPHSTTQIEWLFAVFGGKNFTKICTIYIVHENQVFQILEGENDLLADGERWTVKQWDVKWHR